MYSLTCCGRCGRSAGGSAPAKAQPDPAPSPPVAAPAEQRILRAAPTKSELDLAQLTRSPSRSLLEAASRRLQRGGEVEGAVDGADEVPTRFITLYCSALKSGNARWAAARRLLAAARAPPCSRGRCPRPGCRRAAADARGLQAQPPTCATLAPGRWTSDPAVSELFDDACKLVTPDRHTFHGRAAVLRRLDKGKRARSKFVHGWCALRSVGAACGGSARGWRAACSAAVPPQPLTRAHPLRPRLRVVVPVWRPSTRWPGATRSCQPLSWQARHPVPAAPANWS